MISDGCFKSFLHFLGDFLNYLRFCDFPPSLLPSNYYALVSLFSAPFHIIVDLEGTFVICFVFIAEISIFIVGKLLLNLLLPLIHDSSFCWLKMEIHSSPPF